MWSPLSGLLGSLLMPRYRLSISLSSMYGLRLRPVSTRPSLLSLGLSPGTAPPTRRIPRMSVLSVLDGIGAVFEKIFKVAVPVLTDIEPLVNALLPTYAPLYDEAVSLITMAEAAFGAAGVKNAGPAKLA